MAKYKISVALLSGVGFVATLVLLLNLKTLVISIVLSTFLLPGGVFADFLLKPKEFSPPLAVLAANVLVYSGIAYAMILVCCRSVTAATMRLAAVRLAAPVAILLGLACIPVMNPLLPRGLIELAKQETELQGALPLGVGLDKIRAVLQSREIQSQEEIEISEKLVLKREDETITAAAGERIVLAKIEKIAYQFPCGYDIQIVLLLGQDDRLKQRYIHRSRVCP
jgi:hypothetical protein